MNISFDNSKLIKIINNIHVRESFPQIFIKVINVYKRIKIIKETFVFCYQLR